MRRTLCRLAAQHHAAIENLPLISISNGTFYRQHPSSHSTSKESSRAIDTNPPLFPGLNLSLPSFSEPKQHWSVLSKDAAVRTTFLHILRGQHICLPPTARSYPYLGSEEIAQKDTRLRSPFHAIQYVGFDAERGAAGGSGMRGAYMSARYESRKEETDFSLRDYLFGNTELNADETLARHPDQQLVDQIMVDLKLEALESMPVTNLSNGQTRRARIAKALLAKPELLLLDGPFMGLDPPTVKLLASILQRLAESHAPRLILSLKPDEEYPAWVTHTAYLNSNFTVDSLGPRRDIINNLHQRARTLWRSTTMNDMTQQELDLLAVSNHLLLKEPYTDLLSTTEDRRLDMRAQSHATKNNKLKPNSMITSRDGFSALPVPVPPPGEPLIEMKGVNVKYNDKSVLGDWKQEVGGDLKDGLWWNVCRGQRWGVFGPNGSGKTTLISLITSDHPQTYSLPVTIFGRSRLPQPGQPGISIFDIQSRIGHSSPEVHVFFPKYLSIRRTIESAWADTPLTKPKINFQVDEVVTAALSWFQGELNPSLGPTEIEQYDAANRMYQLGQQQGQLHTAERILNEEEQNPHSVDWADQMKFGELSFSAQRVALFIRAVIRNPDLVVLDEAFSGMDDGARDKCHLFLSKGQSASFRIRGTNNSRSIRLRGPAVQESFHSRLGRVTVQGLQDHQALIVISHKKDEVPGCVRDWICLPESGHGSPRMGQFDVPLELKARGWDEIWGSRVFPLRTAREERDPYLLKPRRRRRRDNSMETPETRALQKAEEALKRAMETPEQRQQRLDRARESRNRWLNKESEERRHERLVRQRAYARERRAKQNAEATTALTAREFEAYKATTIAEKHLSMEDWLVWRNMELDRMEAEIKQIRASKKVKESEEVKTSRPEERVGLEAEKDRERMRKKRQNESPKEREQRLEKLRVYAKKKREENLELWKAQRRKYLQNETPEQRERRLERNRAYREERREVIIAKEREKRRNESPEQREKRLAEIRAWKARRKEQLRTDQELAELEKKAEKQLESQRAAMRKLREERKQAKKDEGKDDVG